jgi:hypothetical protein
MPAATCTMLVTANVPELSSKSKVQFEDWVLPPCVTQSKRASPFVVSTPFHLLARNKTHGPEEPSESCAERTLARGAGQQKNPTDHKPCEINGHQCTVDQHADSKNLLFALGCAADRRFSEVSQKSRTWALVSVRAH